MLKRRLMVVFLFFVLSGCSTQPPVTFSPTAQPMLAPTRTAAPVFPAPTATLSLTETVIPTTPFPKYVRQCIQVDSQEKDLSDLITGTILFYITAPSETYYLKDMQTGLEYKLSAKLPYPRMVEGVVISPNKKLIMLQESILNAHYIPIYNIFRVFDVRGGLLAQIRLEKGDLYAARWLDNQRFVLDTDNYGESLVVNPFTREKTFTAYELPMLDGISVPAGIWRVEYSPDLEWVAYRSWDESNGHGLIVRDLVAQKNLWRLDYWDVGEPVWAPDGQFLAVPGDGQVYVIDRAGHVRPILDDSNPHEIALLAWSPDNRYLAIADTDNMLLYDMQTDQVFDLCLPMYSSPEWSPDNPSQLIINPYTTDQMFLDFSAEVAYRTTSMNDATKPVGNDTVVLGWMSSER